MEVVRIKIALYYCNIFQQNRQNRQLMFEQSQSKNQKFKVQIRRRQREQIMKKQRQAFIQQQIKQQMGKQSIIPIVSSHPSDKKQSNSVKQIYQRVLKCSNFMDQSSNQQIQDMMAILINENQLDSLEGATLLGSVIQYCGGFNSKNQQKMAIIKKAIEMSKIDQIIFGLIKKKIDKRQQIKIKLYLHCLKSMALVRINKILNKQLLQRNLMVIIDNFISESAVLVFLAYVSQFFPFSPTIMKAVCEQANCKQKITKIIVVTIINNYILQQNALENIFLVFQSLIETLIHLYISCKGYGSKYGQACLLAIIKLIAKFPDNLAKELLKKIDKTKLQDTMIVMLTVSNEETKQMVFQLEQAIVDKTIHELKHEFVANFGQQIIYQIAHGIEYTNTAIVTRSMKILLKIFHFSNREFLKKIESQHNLSYTLEDLCYHSNEFIAAMAEQLKKYLPNEELDEMNDY